MADDPALELDLAPAVTSEPAAWRELDRRARGTRFIAFESRSILNSSAATHMMFWSINPYIGCEFGCRYCYARDTHRWAVTRALDVAGNSAIAREATSLPAAEAFERRILVKENAARILADTLNPRRLAGDPVVIGTATDPYQPGERRFRITRAILEVLARYCGIHVGIITKSPLITRDIDLLTGIAARNELSINISLAAIDAPLLRRLEPRTPVPEVRLRALRRLTTAGLRAGLLIAPVLPGITDDRDLLARLIAAARDAGAAWVSAAPLRMGSATRGTLLPWLVRERPDLAARYHRHYRDGDHVSAAYDASLRRRVESLRREAGIPTRDSRRPRRIDAATRRHGFQLDLWNSA